MALALLFFPSYCFISHWAQEPLEILKHHYICTVMNLMYLWFLFVLFFGSVMAQI